MTVWDGGSRGRGTGDCPRDVFKTLGGKALTRHVRSVPSGLVRPSPQLPAGCALRAEPLSPNRHPRGSEPPRVRVGAPWPAGSSGQGWAVLAQGGGC